VLRAPTSPLETFKLLARLTPTHSLEDLLDLIDWRGVSPVQIYEAVLARVPEAPALSIPEAGYSARDHFREILHSAEFRETVVDSFIREFRSLQRFIFVHIPKCAGTDLIHHFSTAQPHLAQSHASPEWITTNELLTHLAQTVTRSLFCTGILVHGHFSLGFALSKYYRFGDQMFTILREPRAVVLSHVNYVIARLRDDPTRSRPDTRHWLDQLGRAPPADDADASDWREIAVEALRIPAITRPNLLCDSLGTGTAASAVEMLALAPIELVDIDRYDDWLTERWGLGGGTRMNQSEPILQWRSLSPEERDFIDAITVEDRELYARFRRAVQAARAPSIAGQALWSFENA
jgi:hypothetical protein